MNNIIVFCETDNGKLCDVSLELLTKGRVLAETLNCDLEALLIGHNVANLAGELYQYGAKTVHLADDPRLEFFRTLPYAAITISLFKEEQPQIALFGATSIGRDLRFYSIRGKVVACMVRKSQGDFRANVALGAEVEAHEIAPNLCKIAESIYKQTQLDFLGVDLLFGEDKPYFCEINVMPGIEGIEKASKMNIARCIIETIKGDFEDD